MADNSYMRTYRAINKNMRFEKFHLSRYGHFTDRTLDFTLAESTDSDFHLIYGPNEAGKSTTLHAFMDFLFGYPPRNSPYVFKHDYNSLELGATLKLSGGIKKLCRTRKHLTDHDGNTTTKELFDLQGMSREDFKLRFCFDGHDLQEGGESILKHRGELGSSLFSATTGLADFNTRIAEAMESSHSFYEPGRKNKDKKLTELIFRYNECKNELSGIDTTSSQYKKQLSELNLIQDEYNDISNIHKTTERNLEIAKLRKKTFNLSKRIDKSKRSLSELPAIPDAPKEWMDQSKELNAQIVALDTQLKSQQSQKLELEKRLENNDTDVRILSFEQKIREIALSASNELDRLTLISKTETENAKLQTLLESLENQIQLEKGLETPIDIVPEGTLNELETSLNEHSKMAVSLAHATTELERLTQVDEGTEQPINVDFTDTTATKILVEKIRDVNHQQELKALQKQYRHQHAEAELARDKLKPFSGDVKSLSAAITAIEGLAQTHLKPHSVLKENLSTLIQTKANLQIEISNQDGELKELYIQINSAKPTDNVETRRSRDKLWNHHIELITNNADSSELSQSAHNFHSAMQKEDSNVDFQLQNATTTTKINQIRHSLESNRQKLQKNQLDISDTEKKIKPLEKAIHDVLLNNGFAATIDVNSIDTWLSHANSALSGEKYLASISLDLEDVASRLDDQKQRLLGSIASLAPDPGPNFDSSTELDELIQFSIQTIESIATEQDKLSRHIAEEKSRKNKINQRTKEKSAITENIEKLAKQTQLITANTWLHNHSPENIRSILPKIRSFNAQKQELQRKFSELSATKEQSKQHQKQLQQLNTELQELQLTDRVLTIEEIELLYKKTKSQHRELSQTQEQLKDIEKTIQSLSDQIIPAQTLLSSMLEHFKIETYVELQDKLETLQKKKLLDSNLKQDFEDLENAGIELTDSVALDEDQIQHEIDALQLQHENNLAKQKECYAELQNKRSNLQKIGVNDKISQLTDELANLKLQIVEGAKQALEARLGHIATNNAIRIYRDEHRSNMMTQASLAFTHMTAGKYQSLKSRPALRKDAEELIGIDRDGASKTAPDMSDGTRSQLYLSLKVAAYYEHCESKTPWPFIADDVMEKFDDLRAAAALKLFSDMGKKGQILYLTHHKHLVDIAKDTLGTSVNVVEL